MMNAIWLALVLASVVAAAFMGTMDAVTTASIESAKSAVTLALGLIGVMAFWLGMMRIVQAGGLLHTLARWLQPVMVRLFPDVPNDHPAMSAMIMNIASNMLGLGNAATPFGIKAMIELNRLNPVNGVATNAMALFLAINTSNVSLAPLGVIALRASIGSHNAAGIWLPTLLATSLSTLVGILAAKLLERLYPPTSAYAPSGARAGHADIELPDDTTLGSEFPATRAGCTLAITTLAAISVGFILYLRHGIAGGEAFGDLFRQAASSWLLPLLIATMLLYGFAKGVAVYDAMIAGAKEGFEIAVRIIPFLVAIIVAVGMFRASGLLDLLVTAARPLTQMVGFPPEALPMALLRPLSGSGAYGVMAEIMKAEGPDSAVGYLVSTLQGSTETTFYVLAVYFGAVGVTRVRHALAAGLIADVAGVLGALLAVRWLLVG
ncbi:MAG: nucleoside recognition domain-containing protein [Candidatus Binatia bacterium]